MRHKYLVDCKWRSALVVLWGLQVLNRQTDESFMRLALVQARLARDAGEVPVGAVLVCNGELIAAAHNSPIGACDPSAHAEMLVIRQAAASMGNYRLTGSMLYVTLEPCIMCAGVILQARIGRLVYGARDPKSGAVGSLYSLLEDKRLNHRVDVTEGILQENCAEILSGFFREKRIA